MAESRNTRFPFPTGGYSTRLGYQSGDVQTTRGARNVVPDDSAEARTRGGSRPGLTKRYSTSVGGLPSYLIRVSGGENTRAYEFLVAGTAENAFIGQSVPNGEIVPISYSEQLNALSGALCTESGEELTTEAGDTILVNDFTIFQISREQMASYQGGLILGAPEATELESATGSVSLSGGNGRITDASVADFTALGLDADIHIVEITTGSNVLLATYKINSIASGYIDVTGSPFTSGSGPETITYIVRRGARLLDPITPDMNLVNPTGGLIPSGADAVAVYRDRIVWAVGRNWLMSRQGDPGDYDFAADPEDPARAFAGASSEPGQPGDPIVALVPAGYDYLIMFGENSIYSLRGDPGYGGLLYPVSETIGCVAAHAWCYGDSTEIYFLSKNGLYRLPPNGQGNPTPLSPIQLPRQLRGVDRDNNYVSVVYDPEDRGVLIFVTPRNGAAGNHWWFDIETESFWPITFANNNRQPVDAVTFGGSPQRTRRVVMACLDGFIREWVGADDDGVAISSYVLLGPYQLSENEDYQGILTDLRFVLDEQSGAVTAELYVGKNAEEATQAAIAGTSPKTTVSLSGGESRSWRPRVRGSAVVIRLESESQWSFEAIAAKIAASGKLR